MREVDPPAGTSMLAAALAHGSGPSQGKDLSSKRRFTDVYSMFDDPEDLHWDDDDDDDDAGGGDDEDPMTMVCRH